jgi:Uma2 family endonuclease
MAVVERPVPHHNPNATEEMEVAEAAQAEEPRRKRWTVAEYYQLADEGLIAATRVELIEGEILEMSPQKTPHATAFTLAVVALQRIFGEGYVVRAQLPLSISGISEPEPDVAVVTGSVRDYEAAHPSTAVLVVEVSDTTLRYDRGRKASLYARAAIPEYWIIDLVNRRVEARRDPVPMPDQPHGFGYRSVTIHVPGEQVACLAVPDQPIGVDDLLPRPTEETKA